MQLHMWFHHTKFFLWLETRRFGGINATECQCRFSSRELTPENWDSAISCQWFPQIDMLQFIELLIQLVAPANKTTSSEGGRDWFMCTFDVAVRLFRQQEARVQARGSMVEKDWRSGSEGIKYSEAVSSVLDCDNVIYYHCIAKGWSICKIDCSVQTFFCTWEIRDQRWFFKKFSLLLLRSISTFLTDSIWWICKIRSNMTETGKFSQQELIGLVGERWEPSIMSELEHFSEYSRANQKAKESSIEMRYGINSQHQ